LVLFYLTCSCHPSVLHSFPTRRSSDLGPIFSARDRRGPADGELPCRCQLDLGDGRRQPLRDRSGRVRGSASQRSNQEEKQSQLQDRKSTRLNSSHVSISYAVFCLKKKK